MRLEHRGKAAVATEGGLEAVVLAAGAGVRMGGAKLTRAWRDGLLLDGALAAAFAAPARRVWVVTGADPAVGDAAHRLADRLGQADRLRLVHARDHARGLGASLAAGIAALPADAAGAFVFLGDMPAIPPDIPVRLAQAIAAGALAAAPTANGRRGHPVVFGSELFPQLMRLEADEGARAILAGLGPRLTLVETQDPGVLFDVDTRDPPSGGEG
jgi:molybdenum cofactor cytidylyltransferase